MDYKEIYDAIIRDGFFSEYLPSCFYIDESILKLNNILPTKSDTIKPHTFSMSKFNGKGGRRQIHIPEICSYMKVMLFATEDHNGRSIVKSIIELTRNNANSFSPILDQNNEILTHEQCYNFTDTSDGFKSNYISNTMSKIIMSCGAQCILKLDISNCYSSFYLHRIPSIVLGIEMAEAEYKKKSRNEKNIDEQYEMLNELDTLVRNQNCKKTNGLLTGPIFSKILVEGLLCQVDKELLAHKIKFIRYMDDYEVFIYDSEEIDRFENIFTVILSKYGFALNSEKKEVQEFPFYIKRNLFKYLEPYKLGVQDYARNLIQSEETVDIFNKFFVLESQGIKGALRFLLKYFNEKGKEFNKELTSSKLYKAFLLTIISNDDRTLIQACSNLLSHNLEEFLDENDISLVLKLLKKHIDFNHDMEVIWLLIILVNTKKIDKDNEIISRVIESENELAILLLFKNNLLHNSNQSLIAKKATSWILLYELFLKDLITIDDLKGKLNITNNINYYERLKEIKFTFCKPSHSASFYVHNPTLPRPPSSHITTHIKHNPSLTPT